MIGPKKKRQVKCLKNDRKSNILPSRGLCELTACGSEIDPCDQMFCCTGNRDT